MKNNKEKKIVLLLLVCALFMTVGFAAYTKTLNLKGDIKVSSSNWDVGFVTGSSAVEGDSVEADSENLTADSWNYSAQLVSPGKHFTAHVTVKNSGTFNAKLTGLTMSTLTQEQAKYLKYTVYYNGTAFTASATTFADDMDIVLEPGETAEVKVKVEYVKPESAADLPSTAATVTVTGSLAYALAE